MPTMMHTSSGDKTCSKCRRELRLKDFQKDASRRDGYSNQCRACIRVRLKLHYLRDPAAKSAQVSRLKATIARMSEEGDYAELRRVCTRKRIAANPEKYAAAARVRYAVKTGKLKRLPCEVCGSTTWVDAHHDDYSKPLDVIWLCRTHHSERHAWLVIQRGPTPKNPPTPNE